MSQNDNIRVLGGLELASTLSYSTDYTDFPADPKPRTLIVKEGMAYLYSELVVGSGYFTWTPIGLKQTAYLHSQGVASTTWTVTHNFGTQNFAYFVYDNDHNLVVANITIVDNNTVEINLSEAITGTAVFFSIQHVSAPNVVAVDSVTINTMTLRDASGVLTVNNNSVAMEESVASRLALVYTKTQADAATASAVSAEATARAAADTTLSDRIDGVLSNIDQTALDSLSEVVAAFQAADGSLNNAITALGTSASSALATEASDRAAAVTAAIATAASDATSKVAAEATARASAVTTVSNAVTSETSRAQAAESAIASDLADEVTRAAAAEATLTSNLSNELSTRSAADSTLSGRITTEVSDRGTAVTAAIATAASDATTKVAAEATARIAGDATTLQTAKDYADGLSSSGSTASNAYADDIMATEVTARTSADTTLNGRIDYAYAAIENEEIRAAAAESTLTTNLASEVTNRGTAVSGAITTASGDATTKANAAQAAAIAAAATDATAKVLTETNRATAAESTLTTNLASEVTNRGTAVSGAITTAASDATAKVLVETNRATAAEATLTTNLATEVTDRTSGDAATLQSAKDYANSYTNPAVKSYLSSFDGNIIPSANVTYNLGSPTHQFHSVYVGPGTLYINGKAVIQDNSNTMTFSTDVNQNMRLYTAGSGHLELQTENGVIDIKGTMAIQADKRITSSDGVKVQFGDDIEMNSNKVIGLGTPTANTDAATKAYVDSLTTYDTTIIRTGGSQTVAGVMTFTDGIVAGNLTVNGTTTTINSETIKLADNLIDLNSNMTSGTPTENSGIRIMRGDEAATQLRWNEANDKWEVTSDGVTFSNISTAADLAAEATTARAAESTLTTNLAAEITNRTSAVTAAISTAAADATAKVAAEATARNAAITAGAVASATVAASANAVAGANVSGQVSFAATANAVAGANVSGQVNYAAVANSVAVANVSGIGNVALLNKDGNASNILYGNGTFASAPVTYGNSNVATYLAALGSSSIVTTGNISAGNVTATHYGAATGLTAIPGANVTGAVPYATTANAVAGANVSGTVANATYAAQAGQAGTVTTGAQPNVTSVGSLTSLTVTGNITAGNVSATTFTGALSGTATAATTAGTVTTAAQPNITSTGTLTSLAVTGNISAGNVSATTFTGALTGLASSATVAASANAVAGANVSGQVANALVAGTVYTAAQPNITSTGTLTSLAVTGNISAGNVTATHYGAATGLTAIPGANVTGAVANATYAVSAGSATTAGTVTTAAQPNITSTGTLTSLTTSGDVTVGGNLTVSGTTTTVNSTTVVVNDINMVLANNAATAAAANGAGLTVNGAAATLTYTSADDRWNMNKNLNVATVYGNVSGTAASITGTYSGSITSAQVTTGLGFTPYNSTNPSGYITSSASISGSAATVTTAAQPNITSTGTLTSLAVTGNISAGNVTATHYGAATGLTSIPGANVTGAVPYATTANAVAGANVSGTVANATYAVSAGSAGTAGTVTTAAQPNITSVGTLTGLTVKSNVAYVAPNAANTITSAMLNGGTLSFTGTAGQLFSISDSMTGTIFSVNDVSGIPLIEVVDTGVVKFNSTGGFVAYGVSPAVTAAGSSQAGATALTRPISAVSTVSAGQGVVLPSATPGMRLLVLNISGTALNVYPASGAQINALGTNAAYSLAAGAKLDYVAITATQWYSLNATYA